MKLATQRLLAVYSWTTNMLVNCHLSVFDGARQNMLCLVQSQTPKPVEVRSTQQWAAVETGLFHSGIIAQRLHPATTSRPNALQW